MSATNKPFGLQLFSATIHQNPNTHTLLSSPHPTIHAPGNCITLSLCLSVCPLSLFLSLSLSLYTIRSSKRRRVCVDHSSRRSDEIDTLLLLLTRLHKRSPIEQHTEIRTRKKERDSSTPPELARKRGTRPRRPNKTTSFARKTTKRRIGGTGVGAQPTGFKFLAPTVTFRVYSAPYILGTYVGRLFLFVITAG